MEKLHAVEPRLLPTSDSNSSSWVGHILTGGNDQYRLAGQTFRCPKDGWLNRIEIYTSAIQTPGLLELTLHAFDESRHRWEKQLASSSLFLPGNPADPWLSLELGPIRLSRDRYYGFRLQSRDALVAIGEKARTARQPVVDGQEWMASTENSEGNFFSYFNLVFRLGIQS
jgi:hypothetical protein